MSAEEYTPTTAEVRGAYAVFGFEGNSFDHEDNHQSMAKWRAEFDRWLLRIKQHTWDLGYLAGEESEFYHRENPYFPDGER